MAMYSSIDGIVRKTKEYYTGIDGTTRKIKELYTGVDGVVRKTYSSQNSVLAIGGWCSVLYSFDGVTFHNATLPSDVGRVFYLTYGNGVFLASCTYGLFASKDIVNWSKISLPVSTSRTCFDGSTFFYGCENTIYSSTDGFNWSMYNNYATHYSIRSIQYTNGMYHLYDNQGYIYVTNTLTNCHQKTDRYTFSIKDLVAVNGYIGLTMNDGSSGCVTIYDSNYNYIGSSWYLPYYSNRIYYVDNKFALVITYSYSGYFSSSDGKSWSQVSLGVDGELTGICEAFGKYYAVTSNGKIYCSTSSTSGFSLIASFGGSMYAEMLFVNK